MWVGWFREKKKLPVVLLGSQMPLIDSPGSDAGLRLHVGGGAPGALRPGAHVHERALPRGGGGPSMIAIDRRDGRRARAATLSAVVRRPSTLAYQQYGRNRRIATSIADTVILTTDAVCFFVLLLRISFSFFVFSI